MTMISVYSSSVTRDGVHMISGLRSDSVRKEVIGCFSQYIDYLERGD
jgi:hypothetical protein